jgi:uncharacterized protein
MPIPLRNFLDAAHNAIQRHLQWIYLITTLRPAAVFTACCLVFLLSAVFITRIQFQADIFKMFPQKGALSLFLDVMRWTGGSGNAYFLLEGDKEKVIEEAGRFSARLKNLTIDGAPAFNQVKYTVLDPAEAKPFQDFVAYAVTRPQLFVAPQDVPSYLRSLAPDSVDRALKQAKTELAAPGAMVDLIRVDPLYLRNQILPRLKNASEALAFDPSSPYFISRDGNVLIIIAEPGRPVTDRAFAKKLVAGINQARRDSPVSISCAGAHLSAVTDEEIIKKNVILGVLSSLAIVLALYYAAYRRFLPTLLIPVILLYGVVLAVAVGGIFYPTMSVISFGFASLIVGIGTDYSIHLYDRFHFERAGGRSSEDALRLAVVDTGHALFTAGTTTALPFLALALTDVRVLAELGLLVGLGVIFSMYATLFFLPPLLLFMERRFPLKKYHPLPSFGLAAMWRVAARRPRQLITGCLIVVLCSLVFASHLGFEADLKNLQPNFSEAFQAQQKLEKHLSVSPKELIVAVEGKELRQVVEAGANVAALAERYKRRGELVAFTSLTNVMNDEKSQMEVIRSLKSWPGAGAFRQEVEGALAREGFALEPFEPYIAALSRLDHAAVIPFAEGVQHLAESPFRGITDRYLAHDTAGYHLLTYLNYRGEEFRQDNFLRELIATVPAARATSLDLVSRQLTDSVRKSFTWAVLLGMALVVVLLLTHFNSLPGVLYSLFPLGSGVAAMLGIMALAGMKLNFMNVMVLVTIIGMASDFGLHIGHRVRNCPPQEYEGRFVQSGRAVLLSALTTVTGFGSLALTDYAAMASIGSATNIGVVATTIFTLIAVPSFMSLIMAGGRNPGV